MTTTPVEPTHGEPVTFHVVVADPGGLYPFPKSLAYGDGRVAEGFAGPACAPVPFGYVVRPPTGPPVSTNTDTSPPLTAWTHTYAVPGSYVVTMTFWAPCPSAGGRSGTARYEVVVR